MSGDGWEHATAYYALLEFAAAGALVLVMPDVQVDGRAVSIIAPGAARMPGCWHRDPRMRAGFLVGFAIGAHNSDAVRELQE